jgi:hypothetical protein
MTLLNSANLHRARHLEKSTKVRAIHSPFVTMIEEILERGREGVFRAGVDPVRLTSRSPPSPTSPRQRVHPVGDFRPRPASPRAKAERLAHMTELVLGYLFKT